MLLWLFVTVAGQMLGAPLILAQNAATVPPWTVTYGRAKMSQAVPRAQSNEEPSQAPPKVNILKANFEKMKHDAGELADLAKALQQELNKSNENVLSVDVVEKADKIDKLARRINRAARGF